jgi:hypothetical protein
VRLPARLKACGEDRGVAFGEHDRFFRTRGGFAALRNYFQLRVNYGQAQVNRHSIELFILDPHGRVSVAYARVQWDVEDVLRRAVGLLHPGRSPPAAGIN